MTDLPFPDAAFDLVVSQFGSPAAVGPILALESEEGDPRLERLGRRDGAFAAVSHHRGFPR